MGDRAQPRSPGTTASPLDGALARLVAEGRTDTAASTRSRQRWLSQQADEEATLVGTLVDLAERGLPVIVRTGSEVLTGPLRVVGADHAVLDGVAGTVLVRLDAVTSVRSGEGRPLPRGDRVIAATRPVTATLSDLAGERARVVVTTVAGERISGLLRAVGADVVRIEADGPHRGHVVVVVAAITTVLVARA